MYYSAKTRMRLAVGGAWLDTRVYIQTIPEEADIGVGRGYEVTGVWWNAENVVSHMSADETEAMLAELNHIKESSL